MDASPSIFRVKFLAGLGACIREDILIMHHKMDLSNYLTDQTLSYESPWPMYSFSLNTDFALAVSSFDTTGESFIAVSNLHTGRVVPHSTVTQRYPSTKIQWNPNAPHLLGSAAESFRLWRLDGSLSLVLALQADPEKEHPPPLTSFDWNPAHEAIVGTASINTTCTIWDISREVAIAQLIAHDKEVYDIAFSSFPHIFATAGGDGSVRQFDLRSLHDSAILYERQDSSPCLRLSWSKLEPMYLAATAMDCSTVAVIDVRQHSSPVLQLAGHSQAVNALQWAPQDGKVLLTGGSDSQALLWKLPENQPVLAYKAQEEVNYLQWAPNDSGIIGLGHSNGVKVFHI